MIRYVYVMWRKDGAHKIGFSKYPEGRTLSVRTSVGQEVRLIFWVRLPFWRAPKVEATAHHLLQSYSIGQEWFRVSSRAAIEAVIEACGNHIGPHSHPYFLSEILEYRAKRALERAQQKEANRESIQGE